MTQIAEQTHHVTIVSHTHWDREWYQPFQVFRFQLVELVDRLLDIWTASLSTWLSAGRADHYPGGLPRHSSRARGGPAASRQAGRLLIGPWHILPDEFLVSRRRRCAT